MVIIPTFQKEEEILKEKQNQNLLVSQETFTSLIRKHIFPQLNPYEIKRKKLKKWFYFSITLSVVLVFLIIFTAIKKDTYSNEALGILFAIAISPVLIACFFNNRFLNERKDEFLTNILSYIGTFQNKQTSITPDFLNDSQMYPHYVFQQGYGRNHSLMPLSFSKKLNFIFRAPFSSNSVGLFKKACRVEIEENFTGHYKSTKFSVAETALIYQSSGKNKHDVQLFKGVLIAIPLQKEIHSQTVAYNEWVTFKQVLTDFEKVELEDEEFMKEYNIYSTSQIDPRFVLTPIFIERLKKLKEAFNTKKIDFAIFNNHLLLFVHIKKNLFEPFRIFTSLFNMKNYLHFYAEIESICNLVDTLSIDNEKERLNLFK